MSLVFLQINDFFRVFDEVFSCVFTESQLASFHFLKKAIDEETLRKKEFKETRKKGRKSEREGERGERERERKGERKRHSFRELSSHVKDSYGYAPNCICIQISVFYNFILQFIFHI